MRALDRKLLRDLWTLKGQVLAICMVMASGVAVFVMSLSTLYALEWTLQTYYDRYRFAHAFTQMKRAPLAVADRIQEIPGVAKVEVRVVKQVTLDVPGLKEPAIGRLISVPEHGPPGLNQLYLRSGRYIEPGRAGEVLAAETFCVAHGFKPGDSVKAIINGRLQTLRIVGIVLSPEYIYQIRPGEIIPDEKRFGIFWMGYRELASAFNMYGAFNDIALTLMPGSNEDEVLRRLDRLTEPYGGLGAHGRRDQVSHKFLRAEIDGLRGTALVAPIIFLAVSAFLLNVVMTRLISTQRDQIAALKAFGYSSLEVGWHYLKLVLVIVVIGVIIGTALGAWLGRELTELYTRFFRFPVFTYSLEVSVVVKALGLTGGAAVLGTLAAVRQAILLPPAEAMRPEPPPSFQPTILERIGFHRLLSPAARMILRQLERKPWKAAMTCLGISFAVAILVVGSFSKDSLDYVIENNFYMVQRQDLTVTFVEPTGARALADLRALTGVSSVEPFRAVPVRLRAGPRSRRLGILGVNPGNDLYRVLDIHGRGIPIPEAGLVMSQKLAQLLNLRVGDTVSAEILEGRRPIRDIPVVALVEDFEGLSAFMHIDAVHRLMEEGDVYSGAYLAIDSKNTDRLFRSLKASPRIATVMVKEAALQSFNQTMAESMLAMRFFMMLFATVIAFGVVYNSARITLAERGRELATLRVIGFTRAEVSLILLGELAILTLAAIPLGLALGYGMAAALIEYAYDTELFRMPLVIDRWTYAFAATVTLVAALVSGLIVQRMVNRLDLVAVLKSRE